MRSQHEILMKIDGIARQLYPHTPKKDPFYQQYKILVHKLDWKHAKNFIKPEDQTDMKKAQWESLNKLDKSILTAEIKEQCDLGACWVTGNDVEMAFFCATGLLAQFWLLGPRKDKALSTLWADFMKQSNVVLCCEPTYRDVCNEMRFDWERMKECYSGGMFSKLVDKYGKHFQMQQDEDIKKALRDTMLENEAGDLTIKELKVDDGTDQKN